MLYEVITIGGIGCFFLAGMFRMFMVLNSTFAINSLCHMFGSQPHGTRITSYNVCYTKLLRIGSRWEYRGEIIEGPLQTIGHKVFTNISTVTGTRSLRNNFV